MFPRILPPFIFALILASSLFAQEEAEPAPAPPPPPTAAQVADAVAALVKDRDVRFEGSIREIDETDGGAGGMAMIIGGLGEAPSVKEFRGDFLALCGPRDEAVLMSRKKKLPRLALWSRGDDDLLVETLTTTRF